MKPDYAPPPRKANAEGIKIAFGVGMIGMSASMFLAPTFMLGDTEPYSVLDVVLGIAFFAAFPMAIAGVVLFALGLSSRLDRRP